MRKWLVCGLAVFFASALFVSNARLQFLFGGALLNLGYGLQDRLHEYDFHAHESVSLKPAEVWAELKGQNALAASVRSYLPRSVAHPLVALLVCMDARLDTNDLAGDTRRDYYVIRTAGSVVEAAEADMLELAVANGVKVVVLTRHTDCAAEKAAKDPQARARYPALTSSVDAREEHVKAFLARPFIAQKIADGDLLVEEMLINTSSGLLELVTAHP